MNETDARARILAEATRLFGCKGFGATSVREVVDAAGVTKPTLYYWFENKEALFLEAVHARVEHLRAIVHGSLQCPGTTGDRLLTFVRTYLEAAMADTDGCRLMMTAQHPTDEGQPEVDLLSVHKANVESLIEVLESGRVADELRPDVDSSVGALSLLGAANMHIMAALHGAPLPGDLADRIVRNFLHGVSR